MQEETTRDAALAVPHKRHVVRNVFICFFGISAVGALALCIALVSLNEPPPEFPVNVRLEIESGTTLSSIAATLKDEGAISSVTLFKLLATMADVEHRILAGIYVFPEALSASELVHALTTDAFLLPEVRMTIPEGSTLADIDALAVEKLHLSPGEVTRLAHGKEGGLFPDTYFLEPRMTGEAFISLLRETFNEKLAPLQDAITASGLTQDEVIIFASILEREANDEESMRMVSGILWERLRIGMPLQVDATFAYLLHKESSELTESDLEIDSPYNTYNNRGLPPEAIGNPGLRAIRAVLEPTPSDYLYYLSDAEGTFHYAKTFEEHKLNKARYLR